MGDKTILEEIKGIQRRYFDNEEGILHSSNEIFSLLYDLPEDKVIIADSKLRKRKVKEGSMYNFQTNGKWDIEWHFVKNI